MTPFAVFAPFATVCTVCDRLRLFVGVSEGHQRPLLRLFFLLLHIHTNTANAQTVQTVTL